MHTYNNKLDWLRPLEEHLSAKERVYVRVVLWSVERIARALESK